MYVAKSHLLEIDHPHHFLTESLGTHALIYLSIIKLCGPAHRVRLFPNQSFPIALFMSDYNDLYAKKMD